MNERHEKILEWLKRTHRIKVQELVEKFGVSDMTIRRDLEFLEKEGFLKRIHGGAELLPVKNYEPTVAARLQSRRDEKESLVLNALKEIQGDETILLDAGSTTYMLAQRLPNTSNLTVVTNSLDIASETLRRNINTIMLGGVLIPTTSSGVGLLTQESLRQLSVNKLFLGTSGITIEHGFSNDNLFEVEVKRLMIQVSREVIVLADASKFGRKSLGTFASFDDVHRVYTNWNAPEPMVNAMRKNGIEVCVAQKILGSGEGDYA